MNNTCEECDHFESIGDVGKCHRFPPEIDGKGQNSVDEFPIVRKDYWCGEFSKKK